TGSVYSTSNYGVGNWVHLAGVYDGAALRLYVNGMPAGSTAFSGNLYSALSNATLQLGYGTSEGFYDDVRIWNVARTQDDIRATIEQSLTGSEAGLAGYWKLDGTYDAGGGVFYTPDATSNGNDLLLAGNVNQVILPDLIISSVFLPTTILQAAQQIVIDYTIENIGEGDVNIITSTGFYISLDSMYSLDDYFLGSVGEDSFIPSLDVQTWSVFGDLPVDIADGDHWIIAVADINEVLQESDETNNASPGAKFTVVSDVSSPVVSMVVPPKSERLDFDFSITATDDIGVSEVVLYKKPAGSVSYYTTSLTSSTSTFTGSIFASDFDELGVTLFAIAYDLTGKADTTMIETIITDIPATDFRSFGIQNGNDANAYQIIAFPYESKSTSQVFADFGPIDPSKWRLLGYSGSLPYSSVSSLQAGKGYWLIADNAISQVTFSGVSPVAADEGNPYTMSLKTGWNLIGNPYEFILDWAEVILYNVDNNQLIETDLSSLFAYSAGWYNPGGLNEYMGAFVYAYNDIQLKIPFTSLKNVGAREEMGLTVARENINENGGWEMIMEITAEGNWRYGVAGFGAFDQASDDFDVYDMRTPYMFDHFLKATFQDVETETNGEVSRSIHAINDNDTWTFDVSTHLPQGTLMDITFKGFPALHENERIVLFDLQTGKTVDIANAVNYSFAYKPGYTFKVIKGSPSFVASELNLSQVVVSELYPNPSEGAIHLPVFLPGNEVQYTLEMKITDLAGKQYPILEGVQLSAGSHQLSVDLKPYGLAGGLYVLDVSIGTGTSTPITITQKVYLTE
ncbi:MAG: hypothetical protein OEY56_12775, partial [Cyclobacteriaceae bacterium]|nr:hypothetical protein [Cyclobacteriaceae bacterium]